MERRLYRVPEVAQILDVGRSTVYSLIKSGELQSVRVAGCRRIAASDLDLYVDALRNNSAN